ncbi:MAG TPA: protein kinase [Kofleriaceae bacterium]|nr:protein kinase [Kofleriaceae bacterium]
MSVEVAPEVIGELYCPSCETTFTDGETCPTDHTRLVRLAAPADPMVGRELDGRFTIVEKLGQGGMGAVYRANQHSVGRQVAIKVVHANLVSDPEVIKRFLREAKLASQLSHPNSVAVLDFGQTEDGLFYLVMELLEGRTLDRVFLEDGVFPARRLVRIGVQICDALEAAHAVPIVHRDLKPANIMLLSSTRDAVKVLDFGLAKSLEGDSSQMTLSGAMCGTPAFIAPERACGQPCDARSDLYSLGCILFLLGSGKLPFDAPTTHELLMRQVVEPAPPMSGVPLALSEVIDRLLAKDPAQRYQSAAETRAALEAALEDWAIDTPTHGTPSFASVTPAGGYETRDTMTPRRISTNHGVVGRRPPTSRDFEQLVQSDTVVADSALLPAATRRTSLLRWSAGAAVVIALCSISIAIAHQGEHKAVAKPSPAPTQVTTSSVQPAAPPPRTVRHEPPTATPPVVVTKSEVRTPDRRPAARRSVVATPPSPPPSTSPATTPSTPPTSNRSARTEPKLPF